jgi:hypothetical protein
MATFLVLPPRELLEHAAQAFAARLLPGLAPPADLADVLLRAMTADAPDTFVVHREELPEAGDTAAVVAALCDAFGAEPGDRVVEVGPPRGNGPAAVRETAVPGSVSVAPAAR